MKYSNRKLITVVCEAALESRLIRDCMALGAKGYTITDAHGAGPRNQRNGDLEGGNIKIEIITDEPTIQKLVEKLEQEYFPHYAVSCWVSDVQILREDRY
ncbi:MAG: transcriptional regulator [Rhodoluna sp.]